MFCTTHTQGYLGTNKERKNKNKQCNERKKLKFWKLEKVSRFQKLPGSADFCNKMNCGAENGKKPVCT